MLIASAGATMPRLEPGVAQTLAVWRAKHYRDVAYSIDARIDSERFAGQVAVTVSVAPGTPLVLDWRPSDGARIHAVRANGAALEGVRIELDHIVIPAAALERGRNVITIDFESPVRATGGAITRYRDREDDTDYVYTLFVPSDASSAFPCFDQPDLKARFSLALQTPEDWRVIANAPLAEHALGRQRFATTEPISTYLFAFAAGPFETIAADDPRDATRLVVRKSRAARARAESAEVLRLNRLAIDYFARYFDHPFPFAKYDLVLIPQFPYGGMEHAGATFLREDAILFPSAPSAADRLRRMQLVFHETCHQWFGDLVTMRWFDDLWLKEGFANFMAAKATEALAPEHHAWLAFHQLKTAAYRTDATAGTTAIYQPIANLAAAKSAYGSIVYSKAPAVLRQAEYFLGREVFQRAVRRFVSDHRYGAASWRDLVRAFERASGRRLVRWADAWVKRPGMPTVSVRASGDSLVATQAGTQTWPMRFDALVATAKGLTSFPVELSGKTATIRAAPVQWVIPNASDYGYGRFKLDARDRRAALGANLPDPLTRALVWTALWDDVRDAELAPAEFIEAALAALATEREELIVASLLARIQAAFRAYLGDAGRDGIVDRLESTLLAALEGATTQSLRITYLRELTSIATGPQGRRALAELLSGARSIPEVTLSSRDRFRIIGRLLTIGAADAEALLEAQSAADRSDDGRRYAFGAAAARSDRASKQRYFESFLTDRELAESWIEEALAPFAAVEHAALTEPHLQSALEAIPRHKRERKIFFVNAWLGAFIGGQTSDRALQTVRAFLARAQLDEDLRRKVLEALDELERTVAIRRRFTT